MPRKRYYKKRNYGPSPFEMLLEMIFSFFAFLFKSIWKLLFKKNIKEVNNSEDEKIEEQKYDLKPNLLTPTEEIFYKILKEVVGDTYQIIPQVQLLKLMTVRDSNYNYTNYADLNQINKKSVDFVLYDQELKAYMAIELDDYTHSQEDRIRRDEWVNKIMKQIGLPLLHIPVSHAYNIEKLKEDIFNKTL